MILIHTMQGEAIYVNPDLIEMIRSTPDTVIFLTNAKRLLVTDAPAELIDRIVEYRRRVFGLQLQPVLNANGDVASSLEQPVGKRGMK